MTLSRLSRLAERTSLVDGLLHQIDVVRAALRDAGLGEVRVRAFVTKDVAVVWPKKLAAQLVADGPLCAETIRDSRSACSPKRSRLRDAPPAVSPHSS